MVLSMILTLTELEQKVNGSRDKCNVFSLRHILSKCQYQIIIEIYKEVHLPEIR